jgi:hypothetical protein
MQRPILPSNCWRRSFTRRPIPFTYQLTNYWNSPFSIFPCYHWHFWSPNQFSFKLYPHINPWPHHFHSVTQIPKSTTFFFDSHTSSKNPNNFRHPVPPTTILTSYLTLHLSMFVPIDTLISRKMKLNAKSKPCSPPTSFNLAEVLFPPQFY